MDDALDEDDAHEYYDLPTKIAIDAKHDGYLREAKLSHTSECCKKVMKPCHKSCLVNPEHKCNVNQVNEEKSKSKKPESSSRLHQHHHTTEATHSHHNCHHHHHHHHPHHHHHCHHQDHTNAVSMDPIDQLLLRLTRLEADLDRRQLRKKFINDPLAPKWTDVKSADVVNPPDYSSVKSKLRSVAQRAADVDDEFKKLPTRTAIFRADFFDKPSTKSIPARANKSLEEIKETDISRKSSSHKMNVTSCPTSPIKMVPNKLNAPEFEEASSSKVTSPSGDNVPMKEASNKQINRKVAILNSINLHDVTASISPIEKSCIGLSNFPDPSNSSVFNFLCNYKERLKLPEISPSPIFFPLESEINSKLTYNDEKDACSPLSSQADTAIMKSPVDQQSNDNSLYDNCTDHGKSLSNEDIDTSSLYDSGECASLSSPINSSPGNDVSPLSPCKSRSSDDDIFETPMGVKMSTVAPSASGDQQVNLSFDKLISECDEASFLSLPSVSPFPSKIATIRPIRSSNTLKENLNQHQSTISRSNSKSCDSSSESTITSRSADDSDSFLARVDQIIASCPPPTLDATTRIDQRSLNKGRNASINSSTLNETTINSPSKLPSVNESLKHESLHDSVQHFLTALRDSMKLPQTPRQTPSFKSTSELFNLTPHIDLGDDDDDDETVSNTVTRDESHHLYDSVYTPKVNLPTSPPPLPVASNCSDDGIDKESASVLINDDTDNVSSIQSDVVVSTGSNQLTDNHDQLDLGELPQAKWSKSTTYTTLPKQVTCDTRDPVKQLVKSKVNYSPKQTNSVDQMHHREVIESHVADESMSESTASFAAKELLVLNDSYIDWDPIESVKSFIQQITREIYCISNPVDDISWKWRLLTTSSSSSCNSSISAFKSFLIDMVHTILRESFRINCQNNLSFKSLQEMAVYARRHKYPCDSSQHLYNILYKEITQRLNISSEKSVDSISWKPGHSTCNPLVLWKSNIVHDPADCIVLRDMHKDSANWIDFSDECDYLLNKVSNSLLDTLIEHVAREMLSNIVPFLQNATPV